MFFNENIKKVCTGCSAYDLPSLRILYELFYVKNFYRKICPNVNPYFPMSILMHAHGRNLKFYNTVVLLYGHTNI